MPVLSEADRAFYDTNGYAIIHDAVPPENLHATVAAIFEFLGMDPNNPDDWYRPPNRPNTMVEMYQHQALWNNRQHPRIYEVFAELLGTHKLWVTEDRVSFKPPKNPKYPAYDNKGFTHIDADVAGIRAGRDVQTDDVQGVLCLTDTTADMGGFKCVPGFHKKVIEWIRSHPTGTPVDFKALPAVPIVARAGDLIVWQQMLPHGSGQNTSTRPRLAQYIAMNPSSTDDDASRQRRVENWRNRQPATWQTNPDERRWEEMRGKTAELTPLGRKLLGLDLWN